MPDRKATIQVRFSFDVIIDEAALKARTLKENPTAADLEEAFDRWKIEQMENAQRNFKTGNSLSSDKDIQIQVS